jgi:DNA-directed RNA polymerase subunit RPC12/RpoP
VPASCLPTEGLFTGSCPNFRKERPWILDHDGRSHEMNESTDTTRLPTCPECGSTRNRNAVPYLIVDDAIAEYTCAGCGAQFESWTPGEAHNLGAEGTVREGTTRPGELT